MNEPATLSYTNGGIVFRELSSRLARWVDFVTPSMLNNSAQNKRPASKSPSRRARTSSGNRSSLHTIVSVWMGNGLSAFALVAVAILCSFNVTRTVATGADCCGSPCVRTKTSRAGTRPRGLWPRDDRRQPEWYRRRNPL